MRAESPYQLICEQTPAGNESKFRESPRRRRTIRRGAPRENTRASNPAARIIEADGKNNQAIRGNNDLVRGGSTSLLREAHEQFSEA
jgi:hypothetical protein